MATNQDSIKEKTKIRLRNSIALKAGFLFTIITVIVLFVSSFLINKKATKTIKLYNQDRLIHGSNMVERSFSSMLFEVKNDISLLSKNIDTPNFENANQDNMDHFFRTVLSEKPNYFQVRLLDVNNDGKELIKFEKRTDSIVKLPSSQLQTKGDKDYVINAINVNEDYYFSKINLNEEHQKISLPLIPTLRAIGKLYDHKGNTKYLIVLNVDLSAFFNEVSNINQQEVKSIIVDSFGDYKYHDDFDKCFGKQRQIKQSFKKDYNSPISKLLNIIEEDAVLTDYNGSKFQYNLQTINYSGGLNRLYIVTLANQEAVLANVKSINQYSLFVVLLICLLLFLLICYYALYYTAKLKKITSAIENYNNQNFSESDLGQTKNRKDEIGLLARTFLKMKQDIDNNLVDLKAALGREKKAVQDKTEFLQNMSHELRTPLNAILGLVKVLSKNEHLETQKPIVRALERSTSNLSGLMHDVLDEQRLKEGKVTLSPEETHVAELLGSIVSNYTFEALQKGLKLELEITQNLKQKTFLLDRLRFEQVFTNLLVNAIKYTSKGGVFIKAKVLKGKLNVQIKDTGQGIDKANLEHIKKRFYRENRITAKYEEGFGLGLSIVKSIIDLFEGSLEVESVIGKGSIFQFKIPVSEVAFSDAEPIINKIHYPSSLKEVKVLHIEDDMSSQLLIKNVFETYGITVDKVNSVKQANVLLEQQAYNLILSDLMLESKNIIDYVNTTLVNTGIELLVFSALDASEVKELKASFIQKPLDVDQLLDYIVTLVLKNTYDSPQLENIYWQYDNQKQKINNYLKILIREFEQYYDRVQAVLISKDETEWKSIKHKIVTHLNSLKLNQISELLNQDVSNISNSEGAALTDSLSYLLAYLRNELRLSLTS